MRAKRPSRHLRKSPPPRLSRAPWCGFAPGDHPRDMPLDICPAARCRRAKTCIAAHGGLFCQRTHMSAQRHADLHRAETQAMEELFPKLPKNSSPQEFRERFEALAAYRKEKSEAMKARWKAGEFDAQYGKWRAQGVLLRPPEKVYRE